MKAYARKLLVERSDSTKVQFVRYGMVAVVAFAVDFTTYALLVKNMGINPVVAATTGFLLGLLTNYLLSVRWVFSTRQHSRRVEFAVFTLVGIVGLGLTDFIIWLLVIEAGQDELLSKLIATGVVFFWNFGARKFMLFNKEGSWQKPNANNELQ